MIWRGKIYYKENKKRKGCSSIIMDVLGNFNILPRLSLLWLNYGGRRTLAVGPFLQ